MRKIFYILLILFVSNGLFAQNKKGIVYLNDGSKLSGLVKITKLNQVKYRLNKESKKQVFKKESVDLVVFVDKEGELDEYAFRQIERSTNSSVKVMKVITKGKITLYRIVTQGNHYHMSGMPGQPATFGPTYSISNYYVGQEGSKLVKRLTSQGTLFDKNFRKAAMQYFKDCPELVKLIENRTYRKADIEEIVKYYNEKC